MKDFKDLVTLKEKCHTTKELFKVLKENNFPANVFSLRRWEKTGIIPEPRRVTIKTVAWRVYDKEGKDFNEILKNLKAHIKIQVTKKMDKPL